MPTSLDSRLRDVQALLNGILEEARGTGQESPSHWELPALPPPDSEHLSSTDVLNWWFRAPQSAGDWEPQPEARATTVRGERGPDLDVVRDAWNELALTFPQPEEHLADERAQAAIDCLYDFLHAIGERDIQGAMALVDDGYHAIEDGQEVDKLKFENFIAEGLDRLRNSDFEVSLAVAPEPIAHPYGGVLIDTLIQFDVSSRADGEKTGSVEHRVAVLRQNEFGDWKIAGLPQVDGWLKDGLNDETRPGR